jgi:hypothetical protein
LPSPVVPLWVDVVVIAPPAWTGMLLGFLSLYLVQSIVRQHLGPRVTWAAAVACSGSPADCALRQLGEGDLSDRDSAATIAGDWRTSDSEVIRTPVPSTWTSPRR